MTDRPVLAYTAPAALVTGRAGDAGLDLPCTQAIRVHPGEWANVPCSVRVALPEGYFAFIMGRSSSFFVKRLLVNTAVIDEGYRGELFAAIYNLGTTPYDVEVGERLCQLLIMPRVVEQFDMERVDPDGFDSWFPSARGVQGFGSTG